MPITALLLGLLFLSIYARYLDVGSHLFTTEYSLHDIRANQGSHQAGHDLHEGCAALPASLGFDYPELRPLKAMVPGLVCNSKLHDTAVRAAYLNALTDSPTSNPASSSLELQVFLQKAIKLIKAHGQLRQCDLDNSLLATWQQPPRPHAGRAAPPKAATPSPPPLVSAAGAAAPASTASSRTRPEAVAYPQALVNERFPSTRHRRPRGPHQLLDGSGLNPTSSQPFPSDLRNSASHATDLSTDFSNSTNDPSSNGSGSGSTIHSSITFSNSSSSNMDQPSAYKYLFAANAHNSGHTLPNMILQLLQLAAVLPPNTFAVSIYESGSSDLTRHWLHLLHLLLLPLRIPHHLVTGGLLKPQTGLDRITLMADLRNAALQPFFNTSWSSAAAASFDQHGHASAIENSRERRSRSSGRKGRAGSRKSSSSSSSNQVLTAHMGRGFKPGYVMFANDVFLCAGDVLRLASHQADMSCGMDFYSAPWDATPADSSSVSGSSSSSHAKAADAKEDETWGRLSSNIGRNLRWHIRSTKSGSNGRGGREQQGHGVDVGGCLSRVQKLAGQGGGSKTSAEGGPGGHGVVRNSGGQQQQEWWQQQGGVGSVWGWLRCWLGWSNCLQTAEEAAAGVHEPAAAGAGPETSHARSRQMQRKLALSPSVLRFYDKVGM